MLLENVVNHDLWFTFVDHFIHAVSVSHSSFCESCLLYWFHICGSLITQSTIPEGVRLSPSLYLCKLIAQTPGGWEVRPDNPVLV